jgi:carbonic anhydrase
MAFSWEPFGRTHHDEPAAPAQPPPQPDPTPPAALPREPARGLAVVTCMDCRIDPLAALGLSLGDAVVLRNAGAHVSDDVLRSLRLAYDSLGIRAVHVIGHTDCAAPTTPRRPPTPPAARHAYARRSPSCARRPGCST